MKDIAEKVVVISGASKGLGAALARSFARRGAHVALCARSEADLNALSDEIQRAGGTVFSAPVDIQKPERVEDFSMRTLSEFGRVDAVINNASVLGERVPVSEYRYSVWREVIDVNINGTFLLTRAFLPAMIKQRSGSIVNLSSGVGNKGKPRWGAYCVSKFGVEGFSYMLAEEVREYSIRVNIVNPGGIATEMRRAAYPEEDRSKLKKPGDIADVFAYLVSDASKDLTGSRIDAQAFTVPVSL